MGTDARDRPGTLTAMLKTIYPERAIRADAYQVGGLSKVARHVLDYQRAALEKEPEHAMEDRRRLIERAAGDYYRQQVEKRERKAAREGARAVGFGGASFFGAVASAATNARLERAYEGE